MGRAWGMGEGGGVVKKLWKKEGVGGCFRDAGAAQ